MLSLPKPSSVPIEAWKMFAIFISTIVGLIAKPLPMGAIALIGLTTSAIMGIMPIKEGVSGFGEPVIWQIITVFFIARGFVNTGLAKRISFHIISMLGNSSLGMGYGFAFANMFIGPVIPSSGARVGGIIYPILKSIAQSLGSDPAKGTQEKIGGFLVLICLYGNAIVSATFLTAMAGNPIAQAIALGKGINISWMQWFLASCVPGFLCISILPLLVYWVYPPTIKDISESKNFVAQELNNLGALCVKEKLMIFILTFILAGWIIGPSFSLDSLTISFIGVCMTLCFKIVSWESDLLAEKEAWHTLIWMSILITMAKKLEYLGFVSSISSLVESFVMNFHIFPAFVLLLLIYFYSHYLFAGNSSHITAMYGVFIAVAIKIGVPSILAVLSFGFSSSLFGGLTHYSSIEAVILSNSKYISTANFWKFGFLICSILFFLWFGIGSIWWKIIGLY